MKKIIIFILLSQIITMHASEKASDLDNDWTLITTPIIPNEYGLLPLQQAIRRQQIHEVKECIERGDDINQTSRAVSISPLSIAITKTDNTSNYNEKIGIDIFRYLINNNKTNRSQSDLNGDFPAHHAIEIHVPIAVMTTLIKFKSELNRANFRNITPLDKARKKAHDRKIHPMHRKKFYEICNMLEKAGAQSTIDLQPQPTNAIMEQQHEEALPLLNLSKHR